MKYISNQQKSIHFKNQFIVTFKVMWFLGTKIFNFPVVLKKSKFYNFFQKSRFFWNKLFLIFNVSFSCGPTIGFWDSKVHSFFRFTKFSWMLPPGSSFKETKSVFPKNTQRNFNVKMFFKAVLFDLPSRLVAKFRDFKICSFAKRPDGISLILLLLRSRFLRNLATGKISGGILNSHELD